MEIKEGRLIAGTVREKLINYLDEKGMSVYRFAKDSGIPQSTIWSIIKKEDYEVREKIYIRSVRDGNFSKRGYGSGRAKRR